MKFNAALAAPIIALALTLGAVGAGAASKEFSRWDSISGVSNRGTPFCALFSAVKGGDIGQNIVVKLYKGADARAVISLYKDTWNRPQNADVPLMLDFVDNQPLPLHASADAHILNIEFPTDYLSTLLGLIADRPAMQVIFTAGNEGTWVIPGAGSKAAIKKLLACMGHPVPKGAP